MKEDIYWKLVNVTEPSGLWSAVDDELASRERSAPKGFPGGAERWVLYGAGRFGQSVLRAWAERGIAPDYCVDGDPKKWGTMLEGVAVCRPEQLFSETLPVAVVIAAMATHEIEQSLRQHAIQYLFAELDGTTGLVSGHSLVLRKDEFSFVYGCLADEASRRVYLEVAKAWMFQRFHFPMKGNIFTANVATYPQYFPDGIISLGREERYVDCGTYDGDSIVAFFSQARKTHPLGVVKALGVEVDNKNVQKTRDTLSRYGLEKVEIVHAGVGAIDRHERISAFHTCNSENQDDSGVSILRLDTILDGWHPTFIKMDVEGAELDALDGASDVITRDAPTLAVCIYHRTSHLIDVPRYLVEIETNKSPVFLRHHSAGTLWETVCYRVSR